MASQNFTTTMPERASASSKSTISRYAAHPVGLGREALDALDEHAPVPAAVEDGEVPAARQVPPEAPEVGLRALLLGGRRDGDDVVAARVERARHAPDRAALAGGVVALEDEHARVLLAEALVRATAR